MKNNFYFLPIFVLIVLLILNTFRIQDELHSYNNSQLESIEKELNTIKINLKKVSDSIFDNLINTPNVIEIFQSAHISNDEEKKLIRQKLFKLLLEKYKKFTQYGIQQLHFHLPNNDSFLRFHKPEKFGDNLTKIRQSVKNVNYFQKSTSGFEEGKIFNGYRYVYPMSDSHGNHIGSVEVSASLLSFKDVFEKSNNSHIDFILKKDIVYAKLFKSQRKNYKKYYNFQNFVIQTTLYDKNEKLYKDNKSIKKLFEQRDLTQKLLPIYKHHITKFIDKKLFTIFFLPLQNDFLEKDVGYTIVIKQSSYFKHFFKGVILSYLFIILISILLAFVLYKSKQYIISIKEKEKLQIETYTDPLTHLKNRKAYNEKLEEYLLLFERYGIVFSMVILDIDYFKKVNDTFGHPTGDKVLIELSNFITSIIRKNDFFFRIGGGEEFVLLLPHTKLKTAFLLSEKIRKRVQNELKPIKDQTITISLGVSEVKSGDCAEQLFLRTDACLYESKRNGRNKTTSTPK
jgi:diguanylate cyclase (GGDEF)-like protein